ncbi:MAG: STAS domain-containing protein [bacterium]
MGNPTNKTRIPDILQKYQQELLIDWMKEQTASITLRLDLISESELRQQSSEFLNLLTKGARSGQLTDITAPEWDDMRAMLVRLSRIRAEQGFTSSEAATFIFSLKQPLFAYLFRETGQDSEALKAEIWLATVFLDKVGLFVTEKYQESREGIIARQRKELLELSTPVVKLWEGVLALPLIGTLDSERTQTVMESLLNVIAETGSAIAIIDITGVPTVDTLVAQYLLKTVAAARLMGTECFISGIRPQIAQAIVHLGVDISDVTTRANLADAFALALKRVGIGLARIQSQQGQS